MKNWKEQQAYEKALITKARIAWLKQLDERYQTRVAAADAVGIRRSNLGDMFVKYEFAPRPQGRPIPPQVPEALRDDYRTLRRKRYSQAEALRALGIKE